MQSLDSLVLKNYLHKFETTPKLLELINRGVKIRGREPSNQPKLIKIPLFIMGFRVESLTTVQMVNGFKHTLNHDQEHN